MFESSARESKACATEPERSWSKRCLSCQEPKNYYGAHGWINYFAIRALNLNVTLSPAWRRIFLHQTQKTTIIHLLPSDGHLLHCRVSAITRAGRLVPERLSRLLHASNLLSLSTHCAPSNFAPLEPETPQSLYFETDGLKETVETQIRGNRPGSAAQ